jgi:hypothetical protein
MLMVICFLNMFFLFFIYVLGYLFPKHGGVGHILYCMNLMI